MALVPYQEPGSCDNCRAGGGFYRPPPPIPSGQQTNYPLQTLPNVEERLLQLEGDKDSLHLQVSRTYNLFIQRKIIRTLFAWGS